MGNKFSRSLALARESLAVLRRTPSLMWFPIISGISTLLVTASFVIPIFLTTDFNHIDKTTNTMARYAVLAAYYLVSYFVIIFFNSGLVACANASLRGEETSFSQGFGHAMSRLPAILGWTVISATVGMILNLISERMGIVGKIVVALIGGAWNLITYFVVPIIVIDHGSPIAAIKKSGAMLRTTWGENLIGNAGIGLVIFYAALIPVLPIILMFSLGMNVLGLALVGVCVLYWLVLAILGASLSGVYQTALYVYSSTGKTPSGFSQETIGNAFSQKEPGIIGKYRKR